MVVVEVALVSVGFTLEGDIAVGVTLSEETHEPFHEVAEVESDEKQFAHLSRMDRLVVERRGGQWTALPAGENNPAEIDRGEARKGNNPIIDDFHGFSS